MTVDGVTPARERLLQAVRAGAWERVPQEAEGYGAAVRADERRRVLDDITTAIERLFEASPDDAGQAWRERCLAIIERLR